MYKIIILLILNTSLFSDIIKYNKDINGFRK